MIAAVLVFSLIAFALSFVVGRQRSPYAVGELSFYVFMIAWGSLLYGFFLSGL